MITIKEIKRVKTLEDLENLGIGDVYSDISHRGGGVGFKNTVLANYLAIDYFLLPNCFGAGCNYMGGGIRGSIFPSTFNSLIKGKIANILTELALACVRVYEDIENENSLNDELDADGETNYDALATNAVRTNGLTNAY
jgi:hypothetical protein